MDGKMPPADVFNANCASRQVLELLAEKWALLVIDALGDGAKRTAELRQRVGGISEKMLIQTVRKLERNGFVTRKVFPQVPPRVEYRLSELGRSLVDTVAALDRWVEDHIAAVEQARRRFDAANANADSS
jgi:DNA-binding HxlR family transcriptional regulator